MSWGVSPWVSPVWDPLGFLDLGGYFLPYFSEGNSHPNPRNPESPKQHKPKVKHPKTHTNEINEDQTQRTNIKSSKGKNRK